MKILDRYIAKPFIISYFYSIILFLLIYVVIDIFGHLDEIMSQSVSFGILMAYYLNFAPIIIIQVSPIAMLISTLYNLSHLNKNNEITGMRASGISIWKIISPMIIFGAIITILILFVDNLVVARAYNISSSIKQKYIESSSSGDSKNKKVYQNVTLYASKNRLIYARSFDQGTSTLKYIIIHQHDANQNLSLKISAEKAEYKDNQWTFYNVSVVNVDNTGKILDKPEFYSKKVIDLNEKPRDFLTQNSSIEYMGIKNMLKYIKIFSGGSKRVLTRLKAIVYNKILFPFTNIIVIFIGAAFALKVSRGGIMLGMGMGLIIALLYYFFYALFSGIAKSGILPPLLSSVFPHIFFVWIAYYNIKKLN